MLLSLVLQLTAQADATLGVEPGRAAQGLFLHWIEQRDPALSVALHDSSEARPYTTSGLLPAGRYARTGEVRAGGAYWLRFTTLTAPLSHLLLESAEGLPGSQIDLGGALLTVQSVASDSAAQPWTGHSSYDDLAQAHFLNVANPPRRVAFEFASPTTFHHTVPNSSATGSGLQHGTDQPGSGHRQLETGNRQPETGNRQLTMPLPLPELVFGSLLARWNAFAPLTLPEEVRRYAQECLAISRYRLQTQVVRFGQAMSVGFTGQCQYTALVWDAYWLRAISLLAAYAFYSGVGLRTTVGMGQVHPLPSTGNR